MSTDHNTTNSVLVPKLLKSVLGFSVVNIMLGDVSCMVIYVLIRKTRLSQHRNCYLATIIMNIVILFFFFIMKGLVLTTKMSLC